MYFENIQDYGDILISLIKTKIDKIGQQMQLFELMQTKKLHGKNVKLIIFVNQKFCVS